MISIASQLFRLHLSHDCNPNIISKFRNKKTVESHLGVRKSFRRTPRSEMKYQRLRCLRCLKSFGKRINFTLTWSMKLYQQKKEQVTFMITERQHLISPLLMLQWGRLPESYGSPLKERTRRLSLVLRLGPSVTTRDICMNCRNFSFEETFHSE